MTFKKEFYICIYLYVRIYFEKVIFNRSIIIKNSNFKKIEKVSKILPI